jgi:PPP family 3-phenylpropionic acid transporter
MTGVGETTGITAGKSEAVWRRSPLLIRGGYGWYFAAVGAYTPFAALYFRELGFSGFEVGLLSALPPLGVGLVGPVIGAVSDARGIHRTVLRIALATAAILALVTSQVTGFVPLAILIALLALALAPIAPLLDSYGMTISDRIGVSYGSLRVWGSAGFMATVLVVGRLMGDEVSSLLLVAYAICLGIALLFVFGLPRMTEGHALPAPGPTGSGFASLRQNRPLMLLLLIAFLISCGGAVMNIYLGIHLEELDGTSKLVGLAFAISAASELPIVAFGGWFLRHLGAPRLIALATGIYAFRYVVFSVAPSGLWLLPVQTLHGLSYGIFLMASVTLAHRLAGPAHAATAQGLLTAMSFGFGSIAGSLVGGAFLDRIGTDGLFRGAALMMVVTLSVLIIGQRRIGLTTADQEPTGAAPV